MEVYLREAWYRERSEPELQWEGHLRARDAVLGPAARASLAFTLSTATDEIPIYAANVAPTLQSFTGRKVRVVGKLVDLSREGSGRELWPGTIESIAGT